MVTKGFIKALAIITFILYISGCENMFYFKKHLVGDYYLVKDFKNSDPRISRQLDDGNYVGVLDKPISALAFNEDLIIGEIQDGSGEITFFIVEMNLEKQTNGLDGINQYIDINEFEEMKRQFGIEELTFTMHKPFD
jgi:hypothetical protein